MIPISYHKIVFAVLFGGNFNFKDTGTSPDPGRVSVLKILRG
jgi:hypothetical protein